jgi:hypothetical protein
MERVLFLAPLIAIFIPIVAIVMGVAIGMLAIVTNYRRRKELFTLYHQERMAAIEKGMELPELPPAWLTEDGLADEAVPYNPRRHLLKGLVWLFVGIGLGVAVYATVEFRWALFALAPIGIGLAHLIYYFVEGKKEAAPIEQDKADSNATA